nr:MAG TPA: hypothetical protein [Caudoviricetes sp.]
MNERVYMNANAIINDDMTLEEKLSAIDAALKKAQEVAEEQAKKNGTVAAPVDPVSLTICDGCE